MLSDIALSVVETENSVYDLLRYPPVSCGHSYDQIGKAAEHLTGDHTVSDPVPNRTLKPRAATPCLDAAG